MNLYLIVSEELSYEATIDSEIGGPIESYWIVELVVARSHAQAKCLAWRNDPDSADVDYDINEMPKMAVRIKKHDVAGPARIASKEYPERKHPWLWVLLKAAPHIGVMEALDVEAYSRELDEAGAEIDAAWAEHERME